MIEIKDITMIFDNKPAHKLRNRDGEGSEAEETKPREKALDSVTMEIPDGCIYGFVGFNGAGKSTLMRLICGIYKPTSGKILVDSESSYDNPNAKSNIFFVNDETIEYTDFTLDKMRKYYSGYYPQFDHELFRQLAHKLELPLNRKLSTFSKGMKRQSVVLIGLACHTKYLILDEAFDGLDPSMRDMIKKIIKEEIRKRNSTLIVSSHNVAEIGDMCDKVMRLTKGQLVFADELVNVKTNYKKYQLINLERAVSREDIENAGIVPEKYSSAGHVVRIIVKDSDDLDEKLKGIDTILCEEIPLDLEEIFVYDSNKEEGKLS
ncbi:MAG: ABC transporter ATP-binding protein [Oscillospiraceae bacterium]|nr:ABC transporter ATP-binding protein [Oscillospiraceae bacterium]